MPCYKLRLCVPVVLATLLSVATASRAQQDLTFFLDARAVNPKLIEYVARIGAMETITAKPGQTLADVVNAHCGRIDSAYIEQLRAIPGLDPSVKAAELTTEFATETTIHLPACVKLPLYRVEQRERAEKGDLPWNLFRKDSAGFPVFRPPSPHIRSSAKEVAKLKVAAEQLGKFTVCSKGGPQTYPGCVFSSDEHGTFVEAMEFWNPRFASTGKIAEGQPLNIPRSSAAWVTIQIKDTHATPYAEVKRALETNMASAGPAALSTLIDSSEDIVLYSNLAAEVLKQFDDCQGDSSGEKTWEILKLKELLHVLTRNNEFLQSEGSQPGRANIVIADTGLYTNGGLPFPPRTRFVETAFFRPYLRDPNHAHGTCVSTTALGGTDFIQLLPGLGVDLKLVPINVFLEEEYPCKVGEEISSCWRHRVRPDTFNNAVDKAANSILNLSVGRATPFVAIERRLGADSNVLFVVAAGNDGEALSDRSAYPARYGGDNDGRYNLITVAALDLDGSVAKFSNYGSDYVDIAAPGCLQDVFVYDSKTSTFGRDAVSGTSIAAPLVSFTAALLRAYWPGASPRIIKERILVGSDLSLEEERARKVRYGARLNIVKTLSLHEDVVEFSRSGRRYMVRGKIQGEQSLFSFCNDDLNLYRDETLGPRIRKVSVVVDEGTGTRQNVVYWVTSDRVLKSKVCPAAELAVEIHDGFSGGVTQVLANELVDIVFAEPE